MSAVSFVAFHFERIIRGAIRFFGKGKFTFAMTHIFNSGTEFQGMPEKSGKIASLLRKIEESVGVCRRGKAVVEGAKISPVSTHKNKTIEGEQATCRKVAFRNRPSSEGDPYIWIFSFYFVLPLLLPQEPSGLLEIGFFRHLS